MSWSAVLINVQTGQLGRQLDGLDGAGSVEEAINQTPGTSGLVLPKRQLAGVVPGRDGVAVLYGDHVVLAGPILDQPQRETRTTATVAVSGIEAVLDGWLVLGEEFGTGDELKNGPSVVFQAGSLGTIQWQLVEQAMRRCGQLPIVHGSPTEAGAAVSQEFPPWRLASNYLLDVLHGLAGGVGPDVAFWPRLAASGDRVEWVMVHGTAAQPTIAQEYVPVIDLTAEQSGVASVRPVASSGLLATRIYGVGAGQEAGQLVSMAYVDRARQLRVPVRERVSVHTDVADWPELQRIVDGEAAVAGTALQLDLELEVTDAAVGLAEWRPGLACRVVAGADWLSVPAGEHSWRMVSRAVTPGASTYLAKVQLEG